MARFLTRPLVLAVPAAGLALAAGIAIAQTTPPIVPINPPAVRDSEGGRFVLRDISGGFLRMDTRTGQISTCTQASGAFTCRMAADDRTAFDQEIERLRAENDALRRSGATALARPGQPGDQGLNLPSDAEVDRALSLAERIWRRLRGMIREAEQDGPADRRL